MKHHGLEDLSMTKKKKKKTRGLGFRGVAHYGLAIDIKKYLKVKEEL
jgi:hypothetical protein